MSLRCRRCLIRPNVGRPDLPSRFLSKQYTQYVRVLTRDLISCTHSGFVDRAPHEEPIIQSDSATFLLPNVRGAYETRSRFRRTCTTLTLCAVVTPNPRPPAGIVFERKRGRDSDGGAGRNRLYGDMIAYVANARLRISIDM